MAKAKPFIAKGKPTKKTASTRVPKAAGEGPAGSAGYFDNGRGVPKHML